MPSATSAGPGQNPASPHPTPNTAPPTTSRRSIARVVGSSIGVPRMVAFLRPATKNPMAPIATAPAMTRASDGSHCPARSRNPITFAGLTMPETSRPMPKTRPATKAKSAYMNDRSTQDVVHHEHGREARGHERQRSDQRAWRKPGYPAHAMTAGAAGSVARTDSDQDAGEDERRIIGGDGQIGRRLEQAIGDRRDDQPAEERGAPGPIRERRSQQAPGNAADARDATVEEREQRDGDADDRASRQRRPWCKCRPIDAHRSTPRAKGAPCACGPNYTRADCAPLPGLARRVQGLGNP